MLPRENFFKMLQFGAFWCIFGSDFVFKIFLKNYYFLYKFFINYNFLNKNFKNYYFLYKKVNILDTRLLAMG